MNGSAMVVLSGGQDSTTCLVDARARYDKVHAITFDYGQRHVIEIEAARKVAEIVGVDSHDVVDVVGLLRGSSPLVSPNNTLETYDDFKSMDATIGSRIELTFVPLRNPLFLVIAANYALSYGCRTLITGVCAMDNANYPDCTPGFIASVSVMMNTALGVVGTDKELQIETPLLYLTKAETVKMALGTDLGRLALSYSHTCYAGEVPPCGKCHACVLRAEGFRQAGEDDPLVQRTRGVTA